MTDQPSRRTIKTYKCRSEQINKKRTNEPNAEPLKRANRTNERPNDRPDERTNQIIGKTNKRIERGKEQSNWWDGYMCIHPANEIKLNTETSHAPKQKNSCTERRLSGTRVSSPYVSTERANGRTHDRSIDKKGIMERTNRSRQAPLERKGERRNRKKSKRVFICFRLSERRDKSTQTQDSNFPRPKETRHTRVRQSLVIQNSNREHLGGGGQPTQTHTSCACSS